MSFFILFLHLFIEQARVSISGQPLVLCCRDYKNQYLKQSPTRIGQRYRKAVYTLFTNDSFTVRQENKQRKTELGILGPVIRAQINDVIMVRWH